MGRPTIYGKPMTATERAKRARRKARGIIDPQPEPTLEQQLKRARREIWELHRLVDKLRADLSAAAHQDYGATAPLRSEIVQLKRLLTKHGIEDA
jgi:hypothetical protein